MENNPKLLVPNCYPSSTVAMREAIANVLGNAVDAGMCIGCRHVQEGILTGVAEMPGLRDTLSWFPDVMEARLRERDGKHGLFGYLSVDPDELVADAVDHGMMAIAAIGYNNALPAVPVDRYQSTINLLADAASLLAFAAHGLAIRIDDAADPTTPAAIAERLKDMRFKRDFYQREVAALEKVAEAVIAEAGGRDPM